MSESLSAEIEVFPHNNEANMSSNVSNTSITTVSLNSSNISIQSPTLLVSPKLFPTVTLVQTANSDVKLHL
ncbi:unnamed protein product [Hymenolepis diminuta]|uniref:Uncharacterized protein n=1 Tax=Hymenolepis diminuta TaxID=6216 RepID=A0A564YXP3_HYMDI|nr:unnamed protein product [Hymenolepis diminuta]